MRTIEEIEAEQKKAEKLKNNTMKNLERCFSRSVELQLELKKVEKLKKETRRELSRCILRLIELDDEKEDATEEGRIRK